MAMSRNERRIAVLAAASRELRQQGIGLETIDLEALATAIERALDAPEPGDVDELSREPDELNAANDI